MESVAFNLNSTTTARWYAAQLDVGKGRRRQYLRVLDHSLRRSPELPDRNRISTLAGVRTPSTLYSNFGPSAQTALINQHSEEMRFGTPGDVVQSLVIETKVYNHWRYREAWLAELSSTRPDDRGFASETLVRVLVTWAVANPDLAKLLHHSPPLSVIEDLLKICGTGEDVLALAGRVNRLLTRVVRTALRSDQPSSNAVLDLVRDELTALVNNESRDLPGSLPRELTDSVGAALIDLEYNLPRLPEKDRKMVADELRPLIAHVLDLLGEADA
ncbi:hypothetical protein [Dactylosporangium sp. CA-139066]|uniref:hypothetical protein n=1 Tax=Dactylosporangium sp. CA-139066 TaxID=3239930 RepID=UPI003D94146D